MNVSQTRLYCTGCKEVTMHLQETADSWLCGTCNKRAKNKLCDHHFLVQMFQEAKIDLMAKLDCSDGILDMEPDHLLKLAQQIKLVIANDMGWAVKPDLNGDIRVDPEIAAPMVEYVLKLAFMSSFEMCFRRKIQNSKHGK